ncbi:MAG: 50S ribosomal protein L13 [Infirmifilum sp.]|mgnify:CR=1 FL=1|jgi:large subunit ribosomal protein L13|uniref:Large ribosomal subunit protein uL13 n=1 Tax=Infirmifilum uzonense TaxID=1550241 RepID=A0A0F7CKP4_9CREN|nr:50S ribosomal protein L13 [Infirmifilum uzonense]AKG38016.1 50S ribosomal protein L13 [Infirmifilum uzonense]
MDNIIVIDGSNHIAGRLASVIAKKLLEGKNIVVVNADKIIITGKPESITATYLKRWLEWKTYYNPEKRGPKYHRTPDRLFKRMVRGMLPHDKPKGREALKRLKVYVGVPEEFKEAKMVKVEEALFKNPLVPSITLGELYARLSNKVLMGGAE